MINTNVSYIETLSLSMSNKIGIFPNLYGKQDDFNEYNEINHFLFFC